MMGGTKISGQEKRFAWIVGNMRYQERGAELKTPENDAQDMAETLRRLGFDVLVSMNLSRADFERASEQFRQSIQGFDVALFYFAGHGLELNMRNFLVPVDADLLSAASIPSSCFDIQRIWTIMEESGCRTQLTFLDACRSNPFFPSRGFSTGLTVPSNPPGSCVVYATGAGKTADDNFSGRNGLFTQELLRHISIPNLPLGNVLQMTRKAVFEKSNGKQLPADYIQLVGDFYFITSQEGNSGLQANTTWAVYWDGLERALEKNQKSVAKSHLERLLSFQDISPSLWETKRQYIIRKGDAFFHLQEKALAKEWYLLAHLMRPDHLIEEKIKLCTTNS